MDQGHRPDIPAPGPAGRAPLVPTVPLGSAARIFLRPIGSPLPLGFLALGVGTFTLAGLQLSWISDSQWHDVGILLISFVFPLQLLSAVFGFLARDPVAGTGMAVLSCSWLSLGVITAISEPGHTSGAVGLLLLAAAAALLVPVLAASSGKLLAAAVMTCTAIRFITTGGYELTGGATWKLSAGVIGVILAALALYAGLAFEIESNSRRIVLPTGRRGEGRRAFTGDLGVQVRGVQHEAGVREQL